MSVQFIIFERKACSRNCAHLRACRTSNLILHKLLCPPLEKSMRAEWCATKIHGEKRPQFLRAKKEKSTIKKNILTSMFDTRNTQVVQE